MINDRMDRVTSIVKNHDSKLFCKRMNEKICVFRRGFAWEPFSFNGDDILFLRPHDHFVFALTENWQFNSPERDWGLLPIQNRLKAMDLWNRDMASECIKETIKNSESHERDRLNSIESFLYDFRSQFAKTFSDVNTSNMNKKINKKEF